MDAGALRKVRERAGGVCEYCHLPSSLHPAPFQVDHVIAKQHGGTERPENLALACMHCNRYKGPNVAGIDPVTGELTRLFHPRLDDWDLHVRWDGAQLLGQTPVGRVTVHVLFMNDPEVVWLRSTLANEGWPGKLRRW